jgi:O-antigen ligase
MVWLAVICSRGGLLAVALMMLGASISLGLPFFNIPMQPLPITIDRLLLASLVAGYAVARYSGRIAAPTLTRTDVLAALSVAVVGISTMTHDWTVRGSHPFSHFILFYVFPLMAYWVCRGIPMNESRFKTLLWAGAAFGLYLGLNSIAEVKLGGSFVFPSYIADRSIDEFLGRARGPVLNPAGNGVLVAAGLAFNLLLWPHLNRLGKGVLAVVVVPAILLGAYCTLTRSAWMGAAATLAVVVGLALPKRLRQTLTVIGVCVVSIVLATNWESLMSYKRDKALDAELSAESAKLRPMLAVVAWNMFLDQPLWGHGFGQYQDACKPYLNNRTTEYPLENLRPYIQHNVWLAMMVDAGALGLLTLLAVQVAWLAAAWKLWNNSQLSLVQRQTGLLFLGVFAGFVPNGMFHNCCLMPSLNMLLFVCAGLVRAASEYSHNHATQSVPAIPLNFSPLRSPQPC